MELLVRNLQRLPVDEDLLARAARHTVAVGLQAPDSPADTAPDSIGIAVVDDRRIRELNRGFLGADETTDVIAFEAEDDPVRRSGEVIVSADTARRQAQEYGHSMAREMCLLVAHGVLHVLGYEDEDQSARGRMMHLQEQALSALGGGLTDHG